MSHDLDKGTVVRVRTTNGGDITAPLLERHYHTYDVVLDLGNGWVLIPNYRIVKVEEVK